MATILVAIVFDFTNGFHDTANAIATSVSTRAMGARTAVVVAAVLNLAGALVTVVVFGSAVSNTIASLLKDPTVLILLAGLGGGIAWNLVTWYWGLPSSSTHAFIGGLVGAAIAAEGGLGGVSWPAVGRVVLWLLLSPPLGFAVGGAFMLLLYRVASRGRPGPLNRAFRRGQILTSALISYSHGANDAQKSMAAMAMALLATGHLSHFQVPVWVVVVAASAIGFGTYAGGWRIIRTVGWRIYKLEPATGMGAQLTGAAVIQLATALGYPVSTTHVLTGAVIGAGAPRRLTAAGWGLGATMLGAWIVTIPIAAAIGWVAYAILHTAGLS
ncbi:MAG TPA: inorganic phosphate transporter [Candidatus Dormibacteraeota bacterium]|nr:inorganic phosphate transporter [Candidatus Dormibacteraeota bacterium]